MPVGSGPNVMILAGFTAFLLFAFAGGEKQMRPIPVQGMNVTVRQQIIIRGPAIRRGGLAEDRIEWREGQGPRCVASRNIVGAARLGQESVDLIFRDAGWQRVGVLAETETDIDLALESAVTGERIAVEVKSRASISDYRDFCARFEAMVGFDRFYFVTHAAIHLDAQDERTSRAGVRFWGSRGLAERAVHAGLAQWLMDKGT